MMRRAVDIAAAVLGMLLLAPAFLLLALAIRLDSPGRPFYGGWRMGKEGARFRMWKFRTMVENGDRMGPGITARQDPRITRVGALLRKTKLDELPQLYNLLRGDLTLVGPRAEVPDIVARYTSEQREVLRVKPGITGPGQIFYTTDQADTIPEGVPADDYYVAHLLGPKIRIDLDYVRTRSWRTDLRVLWRTAQIVARSVAGRST